MKRKYNGWILEARRERITGHHKGACVIGTQGLDPDGVEMIADSQSYGLGFGCKPTAPLLSDVLDEMEKEVNLIEEDR